MHQTEGIPKDDHVGLCQGILGYPESDASVG